MNANRTMKLIRLNQHERQVVGILVRALCGGDEFILSQVDMKRVAANAAEFLMTLPLLFAFGFKALLFILEYAPLFWKFSRFSKLPLEAQLSYLNAWEGNSLAIIRQMFKMITAVCLNQVFREEPLLIQVGYGEAMRERRHNPMKAPVPSPSDFLTDAARLERDFEARFDAVVIGSGAGGAVVAKELSEHGLKVAIIEEGSFHADHRDLAVESINRLYRDKGFTSVLGPSVIPVPVGRCVGGTTVVNSGTCFRVPEPIFRKWRNDHHLTELDDGDFDRYYSRVEREINVEPSDFKVMSRTNTLVHDALCREGLTGKPLLRNIKGCIGSGMCCYGCTVGAKQSMDVSYLPKAIKAGATLYTHAKALKILTERGRAFGVLAAAIEEDGSETGRRLTLRSDTVIVAAGTFHSPLLLKQSGIARGSRHLGRHLTIHPASKVFAEFDEKIMGWKGTPQAYSFDEFREEGIVFEGIFTPPELIGVSAPFVGKKLAHFIKNYDRITAFGFLISDKTEGRMMRLPFFGNSFIYSLNEKDAQHLKKGVAFLSRLFLKAGAKKVYPLVKGCEFSSLEEVDAFENRTVPASDFDCMGFHPLGTCRMAHSPDEGVCDQNQQVFGTPGLFICDGSVIPTALGVNPQLTIMAFATRLAEKLLGRKLNSLS